MSHHRQIQVQILKNISYQNFWRYQNPGNDFFENIINSLLSFKSTKSGDKIVQTKFCLKSSLHYLLFGVSPLFYWLWHTVLKKFNIACSFLALIWAEFLKCDLAATQFEFFDSQIWRRKQGRCISQSSAIKIVNRTR